MALTLALTACGGGGGGGGGSPAPAVPTPGNAVVFSPASIATSLHEGDDAWIEVTATVNGTFTGTVFAVIFDNTGVIEPAAEITQTSPTSYLARMQLSRSLLAGARSGNLALKLCKDAACAAEFQGSPWLLPYTLDVRASRNLVALKPLAGGADWPTFQRSPAHDASSAVTLDAARFTRRWVWSPPVTASKFGQTVGAVTLNPVIVSGGTVFASTGSQQLVDHLYALNESDGTVRWRSEALTTSQGTANPPTLDGGKIFVSISGQGDTGMAAFDAGSGARAFKTSFGGQWARYYAPVPLSGTVLSLGGYSGGMLAIDQATGAAAWAVSDKFGYEEAAPAADSTLAYAPVAKTCATCDDAGLAAISPATGSVAFRVAAPGMGYANTAWKSVPVMAGRTVFVYDNPTSLATRQLIAFSLDSRSVLWKATDSFVASPVTAAGVVYSWLMNPERVQARSATSGDLLWTWAVPATVSVPAGQAQPPSSSYEAVTAPLLVTNNMLFFSSNRQVVALDLATRAVLWSFPRPGDLSLSANGSLLISTSKSQGAGSWLTAINLQ